MTGYDIFKAHVTQGYSKKASFDGYSVFRDAVLTELEKEAGVWSALWHAPGAVARGIANAARGVGGALQAGGSAVRRTLFPTPQDLVEGVKAIRARSRTMTSQFGETLRNVGLARENLNAQLRDVANKRVEMRRVLAEAGTESEAGRKAQRALNALGKQQDKLVREYIENVHKPAMESLGKIKGIDPTVTRELERQMRRLGTVGRAPKAPKVRTAAPPVGGAAAKAPAAPPAAPETPAAPPAPPKTPETPGTPPPSQATPGAQGATTAGATPQGGANPPGTPGIGEKIRPYTERAVGWMTRHPVATLGGGAALGFGTHWMFGGRRRHD